jgi:abequosyltransferase
VRSGFVKLSFCIPTYNHAKFLGAALDSILAQVRGDFEIVIVDGASTDETPEVVAGYQSRSSAIVYRRQPINRGIDVDMAEAVAISSGDYCWLMSSDDVLAPGAVAIVLAALDRGRAMFIGARFVCTDELVIFGEDRVLDSRGGGVWNCANEEELIGYLDRATGLIALFSYLSVLVFRREFWNSVADNVGFFGSCYAHSQRLWAALAKRGVIEFLDARIVMCRMDTDNFASRGIFRRFMLDFEGYLGIADSVFAARPGVRSRFLAAVRREHGLFRLVKFYRAATGGDQRKAALTALSRVGYAASRVAAVRVLASAGPLVDLGVVSRRFVKRSFGRRRS